MILFLSVLPLAFSSFFLARLEWIFFHWKMHLGTGKSLSEALIFASNDPQYDDRLFIVHENCKLRIPALR